MQATEIDDLARLVEDKGKAVVGVQRLRMQLDRLGDDIMGNVVVIDEHHFRASLHGDFGRREGEIVDADGDFAGGEGESRREREGAGRGEQGYLFRNCLGSWCWSR